MSSPPFDSLHTSWSDFDPFCSEFVGRQSALDSLDPTTPDQALRRNSSASSFRSEPGLINSASSFSTQTQPSTPGYEDSSPRDPPFRYYRQCGLPPYTPRSKVARQDYFQNASPLSQREFAPQKVFSNDHHLQEYDSHDFKIDMNSNNQMFTPSTASPYRFELAAMPAMSGPETFCPREGDLPQRMTHLPTYIPSQYGKFSQSFYSSRVPSNNHIFSDATPSFDSSFTSFDSDDSGPQDWSSSPGFHSQVQFGTVGLAAIENAMSTSRSLKSVLDESDLDVARFSSKVDDPYDSMECFDAEDGIFSPVRRTPGKSKIKRNRRGLSGKRNHRRGKVPIQAYGQTFSAHHAKSGNQQCKVCDKRFDRAEHLKRHEHSTACGGRVKESINPCLLGRFCQMNRGNSEPKYFGSRGDNRNQHHITHLGWYDNKTGSKTRNTIVTKEDALFLIRRNGGLDAARHFEESVQAAYDKRTATVQDFKIGEAHDEARKEIQRLREEEDAAATLF